MPLMFGRKPAIYTRVSFKSALAMKHYLDPLREPPAASNDYVSAVDKVTGGDWGMLGNDKYGDCVKADDGHYLMLRTANIGQVVIPTEPQILADYFAETGGGDDGLNETEDGAWMVKNGLLGHRSQIQARLDPTNLSHIRWGVQLFGRTRLGIAVTGEMQDQFNAGQPWIATDMSTIEGLHDVPIVRYDPGWLYVVTWGRLQRMSLGCYIACCANLVGQGEGEAHVELFPDWITSQGTAPNNLDMTALANDLTAIGEP